MSWVTLKGELINKATLLHLCKNLTKEKWIADKGLYVIPITHQHVRFSGEVCRIIEKFFPNGTILMLEPKTTLEWHCDKHRKCGINVLLEYSNSYTLHGKKLEKPLNGIISFDVVNYEVGKPVLFDTTCYHTVINFDEKPRFLLTLDFEQHTYQQLYEEAVAIGAV